MDLCDGLRNRDYGLSLGVNSARRVCGHGWSLALLLSVSVSMFCNQTALCTDCQINGTDDFFATPCDIRGTYATPSSRSISLGLTVAGADLSMEFLDTSTSVVDLGNLGFPILQTRILMTYEGSIRIPILRVDSSRDFGDQVTGSSRITYNMNGAIEWRSDVRGGTGRIEGGAWTPENPPGVDRTRVAGRAESITFDAILDEGSLPCCERVRVGDGRMTFITTAVGDIVQTDLGLGRGLRLQFSGGSSSAGGVVRNCETSSSCEENPDVYWVIGPSESTFVFDLGAVQPLIPFIPTGSIRGRLLSEVPIDTEDGVDVQRATVSLIPQSGFCENREAGRRDRRGIRCVSRRAGFNSSHRHRHDSS